MLELHRQIAKEGLRPFKMLRADLAKHPKELRDRRMITRAEFLRRTEPLMERIAAGDLPLDDPTTAHILQEHLKEEEKLMHLLFGMPEEDED